LSAASRLPPLLEGLSVGLAGEVEASEDRRHRARFRALAVAVLCPHTSNYVRPTPHQHLGETVAETANRNRNVYPVRKLGFSSFPAGVAVSGAGHRRAA
jgi:hypothetical protein